MFSGDSLSVFKSRNIVIWFGLAFQAGAINATALLFTGRFVTHVTGLFTWFGVDVGHTNWREAFGILVVPIFFVLGTMVSAFLVDRRMLRGAPPRSSTVLFLMATINLAIMMITDITGFAKNPTLTLKDYILLAAMCFVSGLQNALITSASGATVRTTHLTGTSTDLGIGIVRVLFHLDHEARRREIRANWMRFGLIASFSVGAATAGFLYLDYRTWVFTLPAIISTTLWTTEIRRSLKASSRRKL